MKWAVIVFPGSNCDEDAAAAIRNVTGAEADLVWHTDTSLTDYDAIVLPGGFSYGDYLRSGAIASFSPIMKAVSAAAVAGKPVLGICNGFQMLTESGLLPGALLRNDHLQFRCEMAELTVETTDSPFTALYRVGERVRFPIAHGDGRYLPGPDAPVAFRYVSNPNGSERDIAGVLNQQRNVLGLMPHPERAVATWMGSVDGARLLQSVVQWFTGTPRLTVADATSTDSSAATVAAVAVTTELTREVGTRHARAAEVRPALPKIGAEPTPEQIAQDAIYRQLGLTREEYERLVQSLGRLPNYVEAGMFGVLWSEHCSYKSSRVYLKQFPTDGPQVLQGPGENAGIVEIGDGLAVAFKMESHNHPSAIEPVQGAATGVGGILRDVFTMGARPIAFLDSLRFGSIDDAEVRNLFRGVVSGIGMYGNCVGIPTVGGEVSFDPSYQANPLVNAMCVGVLRKDEIVRGAATGVGNPVFVVGARTGRDGIHGATFASAEDPHTKERSAVQVGDPFLGKLLMEACLELISTGAVVGIQDMGAAGLTSSAAEMASRAGGGMVMQLDQVPVREEAITPYEMMLSESQERMLAVLQKGQEGQAFEILRKWGLEVAEVGYVTDSGNLQCKFGDTVVADVPVSLLVDEAPLYQRPVAAPAPTAGPRGVELNEQVVAQLNSRAASNGGSHDLTGHLLKVLEHPSIAHKGWVFRQYDTTVRTSTVTGPGSDAAIVKLPGVAACVALTTDGNGRYTALNPRRGGAIAVAEAARNITCSGGEPLAITNCLNFGNPEKPEIMYQFAEATAGMSEACRMLGTPVVSGNVSLYNESGGQDIDPTPVVGMVGRLPNLEAAIPGMFQATGSAIVLVGPVDDNLDGSLFAQSVSGSPVGDAPSFDLKMEVSVQRAVQEWMKDGGVLSAHDVSEGGIGVTLAEMCSGDNGCIGAHLNAGGGNVREQDSNSVSAASESGTLVAGTEPQVNDVGWLFSEGQSRILLEVAPALAQRLVADALRRGVPAQVVGTTGGDRMTMVGPSGRVIVQQSVATFRAAHRTALAKQMAQPSTTQPQALLQRTATKQGE